MKSQLLSADNFLTPRDYQYLAANFENRYCEMGRPNLPVSWSRWCSQDGTNVYCPEIGASFYGQAAQDLFVLFCLKFKYRGAFVEIGSNDPIFINNTFMLERAFDWRGLMVEFLPQFEEPYQQIRSSSTYLIGDAMQVDYRRTLAELGAGQDIDYLQIDLEWQGSMAALVKLEQEVMDDYRFAVVTFEHDFKDKPQRESVQRQSRELLLDRGYSPVFSDVKDLSGRPYEDWYVHPGLVDMDHVSAVTSAESLTWKEVAVRLRTAIDAMGSSDTTAADSAWRSGSDYLKLPPRAALRLPREANWIPSAEARESLCFVTIGGGDRVFADMVDAIESLRNTPSYSDHPVLVIDTGLSERQRQRLVESCGVVKILSPPSSFNWLGGKHQSWLSIAWVDSLVTGYRFCFHLECDTWIQDERAVDKLLILAERQGWAMDGYNVGVYCIDKTSGYGDAWRSAVNGNPLIMEKTASSLYRDNKLKYLPELDNTRCPGFMKRYTRPPSPLGLVNNYLTWHMGLPLVDSHNRLVDPIRLNVVGIFHTHRPCEYVRRGNYQLFTRGARQPLGQQEWERHLDISRMQLAEGPSALNQLTDQERSLYRQPISLRFRSGPVGLDA